MRAALIAALAGVAAAAPAATNSPWDPSTYKQTQLWYDYQLVDHFNYVDDRTWSQRYWLSTSYFNPQPNDTSVNMILYLCGEYTCQGVTPSRMFPAELAYEQNALVLVAEHRFYGQSYPFPDLATENLPYLTLEQALADASQLQLEIQRQVLANYSLPANTSVRTLVVGGSYPGFMSAAYRLKYPHLTVGSLASSGVVNAILEFPEFDQQVAASAGPVCAGALRNVTAAIEAGMPGVKSLFGPAAAAMDDGDFYFMMADAAAEGVQYGYRQILCDAVTPPVLAGQSPLPAFVNYTLNFWEAVMGNSPAEYDSNILADPVNGGDARSWAWQTCTEVGYWQIAPTTGSIRSQNVNMSYYQNFCNRVFNLSLDSLPATDRTNALYGGADIMATNTVYTQGVEDPWRWAGVTQEPSADGSSLFIIDCPGCGHCFDLHTPSPSDPIQLSAARNYIRHQVRDWFSQAE